MKVFHSIIFNLPAFYLPCPLITQQTLNLVQLKNTNLNYLTRVQKRHTLKIKPGFHTDLPIFFKNFK